MTFIVIHTTTKPAEANWFTDTNPDHFAAATAHREWLHTSPGLVSRIQDDTGDANVKKVTLMFETEEAYNNFVIERSNQEFWLTRKSYNDANGIITQTETFSENTP